MTQEEIDTIYKKEFLTERLSQVRDIFIFMCYTGLSYIEAAQLTEDNIKSAFDGHQWVMTKRQKTSVPSNIRLLEVPLAIIEKYRDKQRSGKLFSVCSNQKMNEYLKEITTICGITKTVTCHTARHRENFYQLLVNRLRAISFSIGNDLETSGLRRFALLFCNTQRATYKCKGK